ncbi:acetolactate decarboxylase [Rubrivirga sp.]|uniref:acetolactate decarboxylase n=1 Tax=Rubrivirga sp. TaxID=1885344 RepID=UPI003B52F95C
MTRLLTVAAAAALTVGPALAQHDPARLGPEPEGAGADRASAETGFWVRTAGTQMRVMRDGDLSARAALDSLAHVPGLYAIGPVEGLRGEVTVYDGVPSISTVADGRVAVDESFGHRAAFLVYASATDWRPVPVTRDLDGLADVEAFVEDAATRAGLDLDGAFPFRIEGHADTLVYHVLNKTDDAPHSHAAHDRVKAMFSAADVGVDVVGFWGGTAGQGVFTHRGERTHLHARLSDRSASGHVDGIRVAAGATLHLPR